MKLAHFAITATLIVAVGLSLARPSDAAETCSLKQLASLPLSSSNGRALIVPASINGTELRFMLASADNISILMQPVAEKLNLPIKELYGHEIYGEGGRLAASKTRISEFKIGGNVGHDFEMLLMKDSGNTSLDYDGTLGSQFLWQFDIEINLLEEKINFFDHDHCAGNVVYWNDTHFEENFHLSTDKKIILHTLINNTNMNAILSLGSSVTTLNWIAANKLGITENTPNVEEIGNIKDFNGVKIKDYKYKLDSLEIGGEKLSKFPVHIFGNGITMRANTGSNIKQHDYDEDVEIGVDFLIFNRVFISYDEHKIYFTPYTGEQIKSLYARYKS